MFRRTEGGHPLAIEIIQFETVSRHGTAIQELHRQDPAVRRGLTVLFPGQAYSCERPLLHFARLAAQELGHDVLCLQYGFQASRSAGPDGDFETLAGEAGEAIAWALREVGQVPKVTIVAKSIGTFVTSKILQSGSLEARALLLTPVERAASLVRDFSAKAVIGTADPFFDRPGIQASITEQPESWNVIAGLDHSLQHPEDVMVSLTGLRTTVEITRAFLAEA